MDIPMDLPMDLPVIDLAGYLSTPRCAAAQDECVRAAQSLTTFGALVLHDPRASEADNATFLDLLEDYFAQPAAALRRDERPELSYQVGVTLENTEKPKCASDEPCLRVIARLDPAERPLDISAQNPDPKCRFFWRMNEAAPKDTSFPALNAENVVPQAEGITDRWTRVMDTWGTTMKKSVETLAEMAAVGLGLPATTFCHMGRYGPHLLAPTASDLSRYGEKDTILAGFHTDLNFLTIHGRSRYPGLHIWARNTGRRIAVRIPAPRPGGGAFLLVQAAKQLEHLTGGLVKAGYHEVVVNQATLDAMARRRVEAPGRPLVRISSTFFWHLSSDEDLVPIPKLADEARRLRDVAFDLGEDEGDEVEYPPMKVGQQVQKQVDPFPCSYCRRTTC